MDLRTSEFYKRYADNGTVRNEAAHSAVSAYFERAFKAGGKVLDVGAGSGRDMAVLRGMGFDAYGLEPNGAMRAFALGTYPELRERLQEGALPEIGFPFGGHFDGILCSAVMMHIPEVGLPRCAESFRALLNPQGSLLLSLPLMRPDLLEGVRDPDGRFFKNHDPDSLIPHLETAGFSFVESWDNGEHANTRWFTLLFKLFEP